MKNPILLLSLMMGAALVLKLGSDKDVREAVREKYNDLRTKYWLKR